MHGAKDGIADVKPSTLEAIIRTCKSRGSIKNREVDCGCLLILKEQVRLLCGFFLMIIFFHLIGDQGKAVTTKASSTCFGTWPDGKRKRGVDLDRVLLLLARSFEGYSSSWRSLRFSI
jgi:hypothetical protein